MSLKDKLNAKAEAVAAAEKSAVAEQRRYEQTLMRELPRIYSDLASKARSLLEGVNGLKIATDQKIREIKLGQQVIGRAQLAEFEISFIGRSLSFRDNEDQYLGQNRHIDVFATGAESPFKDGLMVIENRANPDEWRVWVPPQNGVGLRAQRDPVLLSDELFAKTLEQFFG